MRTLVERAVAAIVLIFSVPAMAQMDHSMHGAGTAKPAAKSAPSASAQKLGEAVVKKINKTNATVTLAHGALPNGMPPMTMAYMVKDAAWLDQLKVGQKIRFATDAADGDMTVTRYELVK